MRVGFLQSSRRESIPRFLFRREVSLPLDYETNAGFRSRLGSNRTCL